MAFDASVQDLQRMNFGKASLFMYQTGTDNIGTVSGSGYFNAATAVLAKGDCILVVTGLTGTPVADILVVTSATGAATVTTSLLS